MMQRVQESYIGCQLLILLAIHQNIPCINYCHTGNQYKAFNVCNPLGMPTAAAG